MSTAVMEFPRYCPAWCAGEHDEWKAEGLPGHLSHWRLVAESTSSSGLSSWEVTITDKPGGLTQVFIDGEAGQDPIIVSAAEVRSLAAALARAADLIYFDGGPRGTS